MVRKMNLDGTTRMALVATIEELTGGKAVYRRMPTCNYDIGEITVLKDGSIDFPDGSDIIEQLAEIRFAAETEQMELAIEIPNTLKEAEIDALQRLISSKAALIHKAVGAEKTYRSARITSHSLGSRSQRVTWARKPQLTPPLSQHLWIWSSDRNAL